MFIDINDHYLEPSEYWSMLGVNRNISLSPAELWALADPQIIQGLSTSYLNRVDSFGPVGVKPNPGSIFLGDIVHIHQSFEIINQFGSYELALQKSKELNIESLTNALKIANECLEVKAKLLAPVTLNSPH